MRLKSLWLLLLPCLAQAQNLLLTGQIDAREAQSFAVPRTDNWNQQIQWMLDEGEIAQRGDLVVVFDGSSINNQIEQVESQLRTAEDQLKESQSRLDLEVLEAEYLVRRNDNLLKKAAIDAGIPLQHLSQYDHDRYGLTLVKARRELKLAREALATKRFNRDAELARLALAINKLKAKLELNRRQAEQLSMKAEVTGPVIHGTHWDGTKYHVGSAVQATWEVAKIASSQGLRVEAWVNEVDLHRLSQGAGVRLLLDAHPQTPIQGTITELGRQAEKRDDWGQARYFQVLIDMQSPPLELLVPGMSVLVEVSS
ncbi:HlyD family efflux transporter periplasmic adaptor subunit [Gallaecimonas sp. GXIMD4217]|uniref:HlyD family secretion protein n=1 Tax=Gallaecimonas sp. GXIMD4217 TaxID=3131927 RepID=UPI00311AFAA2